MKPRTILVSLILVVVSLFAALNWDAFSRPTTLDVVAGRIDFPLGLLMLGLVGLLSVVYLLLLARADAGAFIEGRRTNKELNKARRLADSSEESRLKALGDHLDDKLDRFEGRLDQLIEQGEAKTLRDAEENAEVVERIEETEVELKRQVAGRS